MQRATIAMLSFHIHRSFASFMTLTIKSEEVSLLCDHDHELDVSDIDVCVCVFRLRLPRPNPVLLELAARRPFRRGSLECFLGLPF